MTAEKAIEILLQDLDGKLICYPTELRDAKFLGIKALVLLSAKKERDQK